MAKTKNKSNRVSEYSILLIVLFCATLVMVDMIRNLTNEFESRQRQVETWEEAGDETEKLAPTPTFDYSSVTPPGGEDFPIDFESSQGQVEAGDETGKPAPTPAFDYSSVTPPGGEDFPIETGD